jgi:intron-binding protein aquarius
MTCTHAALKREKLLQIAFQYDTVVCEEQGQILEISTFIALNLQKDQRLKRIILVGDENQLPPIIKNSDL